MIGDFNRASQPFGMGREKFRHVLRAFDMAFAIGKQPISGILDPAMMADAGQDILQRFARADMHVHVIGDNCGDGKFSLDRLGKGQPFAIKPVHEPTDGKPKLAR